MLFCRVCGSLVEDGGRFCHICGWAVPENLQPGSDHAERGTADLTAAGSPARPQENAPGTEILGTPFAVSPEAKEESEVLPYPPPSYPQVSLPEPDKELRATRDSRVTQADAESPVLPPVVYPEPPAPTAIAQTAAAPYPQGAAQSADDRADAEIPEIEQPARRGNLPMMLAAAASLLVIALAGGWFLWRYVNRPPSLQAIASGVNSVRRGDKVTLTASAADPNNDSLYYKWEASEGLIEGEGASVVLDTSSVSGTNLKITLTVSDGRGGVISGQRTIAVLSEGQSGEPQTADGAESGESPATDAAAMLITLQADRSAVRLGESVRLMAQVANRNADEVTYTWAASDGSIRGSGSDAVLQTSGVQLSGKAKQVVVTVTVKDGGGEQTTNQTITVLGEDPTNWPPEITLRASSQQVQQGEDVEVVAEASDRDRDKLTFSWSATKGEVTGGGNRVRLRTAGVRPGQVEVAATVTDKRGATATDRVLLMVTPRANRLPEITEIAADKTTANVGDTITLTAQATDPDEESLTWRWSSSAGTVRARENGRTATLDTSGVRPSPYPQQVTVIATAVDPRGGAASRNISLTLISPQAAEQEALLEGAGEYITILLTAGRVTSTAAAGQVDVVVPPGLRRVTGTIPDFPCDYSFANHDNVKKNGVMIVERPGPGNGYARMVLRVQPKKAGKPVRLTVRWRRL